MAVENDSTTLTAPALGALALEELDEFDEVDGAVAVGVQLDHHVLVSLEQLSTVPPG
jgi:hypothetical protein